MYKRQPFAREEELAEKTARLKELNILLNMDEKDKTLMDDTPDEGEDVPARREMCIRDRSCPAMWAGAALQTALNKPAPIMRS